MKKRKKSLAQFVAIIALLSIVIWIIWTGMLVLFWGNSSLSQVEYSEEEIQELLESFSWSTTVSSADETLSWAVQ